MPSFTMPLKILIERETTLPKYQAVGLDSYPIFDESYREKLNDKIIDHFYNREIGQETIPMFRLAMSRKMNEIMDLYNQHYEASKISIDPLKTIDIKSISTNEMEGSNHETGETTSNGNAKSRAVSSQTPQMRLAGNKDYATAAQDNVSENSGNGTAEQTSSVNQASNGTNETSGYSGSPHELIFALRATFVNIDMMIIDELEELFMSVWDSGDEYPNIGGTYVYPGLFPYWY